VYKLRSLPESIVQRTARQLPQPVKISLAQLGVRPRSRASGNGIESGKVFQSATAAVVVATDADRLQGANHFDHLVGAGSITHYVAQVRDRIVLWSRVQTRLQSLIIRMNVTNQK